VAVNSKFPATSRFPCMYAFFCTPSPPNVTKAPDVLVVA
jgi:hypothetical protein